MLRTKNKRSQFKVVFCIVICIGITSCTKDKVGGEFNCTQDVSFSQQVLPLINEYCTGCHTNANGYNLVDYSSISSNADDILKAMKGNGFQLMPQGGPMLSDSLISIVECWTYNGKPNN